MIGILLDGKKAKGLALGIAWSCTCLMPVEDVNSESFYPIWEFLKGKTNSNKRNVQHTEAGAWKKAST